MASHIIVVHGGSWCKNKHEGGIKDYIPLPPGGISFIDLLRKLEVRMKKDKSSHTFEIDALVRVEQGEAMRMKVTDQFEWSSLLDMVVLPTLYVSACNKTKVSVTNLTKDIVVVDCVGEGAKDIVAVDCVGEGALNNSCKIMASLRRDPTKFTLPVFSEKAFIDHDPNPVIAEPKDRAPLANGSVFLSKDSMVSAIHAYHLENFVEFRTNVSDTLRYHVHCKYELTCVFSLRGKSFGYALVIYDFTAHSCEKDLRLAAEPKVTARSIAEYVLPNMTEDGYVIRPRDIQGQFRRDFGVCVNYAAALRGRNQALKSMYGDHNQSFQFVGKYLYMLGQMNPGSVVDLQTYPDDTFQYSYFALAASIRAFRACRPVVVIDATHLKGTYRGVMFVASSKDANEQIVPLAFGIGDKENDSSWKWFIEHVRKSFGCSDNLLIVSDQHRSIKNVVAFVYPGVPHGLCTYHIQGNLKAWGDKVIDIFHSAANAYKDDDYAYHMHNLEVAAPGAYAKLIGMDPTRWASCKCPVRRYSFGTSNSVESLNGRLRWARTLPVTSLLEYARNLMQAWFYQRRTKVGDRGNELSEYAEKRLGYAIAKGNSYRVQPISSLVFNIKSTSESNIVDLGKRECSCRIFQRDLIPCSHAARAIRHKNQSPAAYVNAFYSTNMWRETYADLVMPVLDISDWHIPNDIESRVVRTPPNPKQAGRPKTKRIPSGGLVKRSSIKRGETKGVRACSRCQMVGHYSSSCTAFQVTQGEVACTNKSSVKRKRKTKKCRICGVAGHTRQTCKDPNRFV